MSDTNQIAGKKSLENQPAAGDVVTATPVGSKSGPVRFDSAHGTQASGPKGDNPSTAGPGPTAVTSNTPENANGQLNPSAPEDSNTTPGTTPEK